MPFGDGTGPAGHGPLSGRAAGFCAGYDIPGRFNPIRGRGRRRYARNGMGYGFGHEFRGDGFYDRRPGVPGRAARWYGRPRRDAGYDEKEYLKDESDLLKRRLEEINDRIDELSGSDDNK